MVFGGGGGMGGGGGGGGVFVGVGGEMGCLSSSQIVAPDAV